MKFIKKIIYFFVGLFLLLLIALGVAAFNAQSIATALQPRIEEFASSALGTQVRLGKLELSLIPKISLVTPEVLIGGGEGVSGVSLAKGEIQLDWLPLAFGKAVAEINLVEPKLVIEKTEQGIVVPGLNLAKKATSPDLEKTLNPDSNNANQGAKTSLPLEVEIRSLAVENGNLTLIGLAPVRANAPYEVKKINFNSAFSLRGSEVELSDTLLRAQPDGLEKISLQGKLLKYNLGTQAASWDGISLKAPDTEIAAFGALTKEGYTTEITDGSINLETIANLSETFPMLESLKKFNTVGTVNLKLNIEGSLGGTAALPKVTGNIAIKEAGIKLPAQKVDSINGNIKLGHESVQQFSISTLTANLTDEAQLTKPLPITLSDLNGSVSPEMAVDVSSWKIRAAEGVLSGKATYNNETQRASANIAAPEPIKIEAILPYLKAMQSQPLKGNVTPNALINVNLKKGIFNADGTVALDNGAYTIPASDIRDVRGKFNFEFANNGGNATTEKLELGVNSVPLTLKVIAKAANRYTTFYLDKMVLDGLDGSITGNAYYALPTKFEFDLQSEKLGLPTLLKVAKVSFLPETSGSVAPFKASITGHVGKELLSSLSGKFALQANDTKILGFNLAGLVLSKIDQMSIFSGGITRSAPQEFNDYTSRKNTEIKRLTTSGRITRGTVNIGELNLVSDIFALTGKGDVVLPTNSLNLSTAFSFDKDFTQKLSLKVKEIERISDANGSLTFPLLIKGTPPAIAVLPDLEELLKMSAKKAVKKEASKLLDKALGGNKGTKEVLNKLLDW
jgi:hypothetical protein